MGVEGQPRQPWDVPAPGPQPAQGPGAASPEISHRVSAILDAAEREVLEIRRQAREEAMRYMDYARRRADGLVAERQMKIAELSGELLARAERLVTQVDAAQPLREALDDLVRKLTETAEGMTREADAVGDFVAPEFSEVLAEKPDPAPEPGPHPVPDPAPQPGPVPVPPTPEPPQTPPPAAEPPQPFTPGQSGPAWPQAVQPPESAPRPPEVAPTPSGPATDRRESGEPAANGAKLIAIQMAAGGSTRAEVESHITAALGVQDPSAVLDDVFGAGSAPGATVPWARPAPG
jgi:hypothetical protein